MDIPRWKNWPHVLRMQQFSAGEIDCIIEHSLKIEKSMRHGEELPRLSRLMYQAPSGKKRERELATVFYQPSTRTQRTFRRAGRVLGCDVDVVVDPEHFSSAYKGAGFDLEIMAFTTAGGMGLQRNCDGLIIRNQNVGAPQQAADVIDMALGDLRRTHPLFVINAGDGYEGQHPTQTFTDLATIASKRTSRDHFLDGVTVLFPGDIARNRVIRSLLYAFGRFGDRCRIKVMFCCPKGLGPDQDMLLYLARHKVAYEFVRARKLEIAAKSADIIYMTRLPREYDQDTHAQVPHFERNKYVFRKEYLPKLKPDAFVMHPLPINEDPSDPPPEIDQELIPQAIAGHPQLPFAQTSHLGLPVRTALLDILFAGIDALSVDSQFYGTSEDSQLQEFVDQGV